MPIAQSYGQSPGYTAETSTMTLIRVFLHVISMLVVGAFFVVWTVQRRAELALVKALGGSSGYLPRDALAQVLVVLVAASAAGVGIGTGLGLVLANSVPFSLEPSSVALTAVLLIVPGALGALAAVRRVTPPIRCWLSGETDDADTDGPTTDHRHRSGTRPGHPALR